MFVAELREVINWQQLSNRKGALLKNVRLLTTPNNNGWKHTTSPL